MPSFQDRLLAVARGAIAGDPVTAFDPSKPLMTPSATPAVPMQSSPDVPIPDVAVVGPPPDAVQYDAQPSAEQTPVLAEQGPKNSVLKLLSKVAGITGEQPKAGDPYKGPITGTDKINAGMRFAGKIGNALAASAGTPEEKELAEKRAEFGPELKAKTDLAEKQLEALTQYRTGTLGLGAEKNSITADKNEIASMKAHNSMRLKGYVPDEQNPGAFRPMRPDEVLTDPFLSKNLELAQAAVMAKQASAEAAKAHADAVMNRDNPTFQQKERQIQMQLKMAEARFTLAREGLSLRNEALAMRGQEEMANFGTNFQTGVRMTPENAPSGSMYIGPDGNPVPLRSQSGYAPTANMRTQSQMAGTITPMTPRIIGQIEKLADKIGPGEGRWNDLWVNKGGFDDKDFAGLDTDLALYATALGKAHFGSRIPAGFVDEMRKQFGLAQTPDDLISRVQHANVWIEGYASAHPATVGHRQNGGNPPPNGSPNPAANAPLAIGTIKDGYKYIGGDPSSQENWQAVKK